MSEITVDDVYTAAISLYAEMEAKDIDSDSSVRVRETGRCDGLKPVTTSGDHPHRVTCACDVFVHGGGSP